MALTDNRMHTFLFAVQGVGIVFVGIFLAAYLGGLPTTNVLHSEPAFRISLVVIGGVFLVLVLSTVIIAYFAKKEKINYQ